MIYLVKPKYIVGNEYFTKNAEDAIIEYNATTSQIKKDILFKNHIHYAFYKLAENLINGLKAYYINHNIEDTKHEVIVDLLSKIHTYDKSIGSAFSYFNVCARNYIIARNKEAYKEISFFMDGIEIENEQFSNSMGLLEIKSLMNEKENNHHSTVEFFNLFTQQLPENIHYIFPKQKEYIVAYAVAEILSKWESIEIFNKKAIYILIREMTNANTQQITKIMNKLNDVYTKLYEEWLNSSTNDINF